jgi:hypothetical protein
MTETPDIIGISGISGGSVSISRMVSKFLRCPNCNKQINFEMVQAILFDALGRNNRPFKPSDPVILSEVEIYCNAHCFGFVVIREKEV